MSTTTIDSPVFDRIIAQSQTKSHTGSTNSAFLSGFLPAPRHREPQSPPAALRTGSSTSLPMKRVPMSAPATQIQDGSDANSFLNSALADTVPLLQPRPFALNDERGQRAHNYADSLSSINSYSNPFYKTEDDIESSPAIWPTTVASTEDYSDLLYPDLRSQVGPSQSPKGSGVDVHGPPVRKEVLSFASTSREGAESPVEFSNLSVLSSPLSVQETEEYRPSKVDLLLGINSQASGLHGSIDRLHIDQAKRSSFVELDGAPFPSLGTESNAIRGQSSIISAEMPIFASRNKRSPEGYTALVEAVDDSSRTDGSPKMDSRQILVDGSDKPKSSRSATPNRGTNHPSTLSPPQGDRLSTSNLLDKSVRADAVRKNRKIAQVLGAGVLPSSQAFNRPSKATPTHDGPKPRNDPMYRATRSYSLVVEETGFDASHKAKDRGIFPHRPPNLKPKSSWAVLDQETVYLSLGGRRHSSPLSPSFDPSSIYQHFDSDSASLSSLGSIIDQKNGRPHSPASFMEMSDDEGAKTPKRRPSIGSIEPGASQNVQPTLRAASSDDLLTVSSVLEMPRHISVPNTPLADNISPYLSQNKERPISSDITFQTSTHKGHDYSGDDDRGGIDGDDAGLERQRKREKLAKIHRYLGSKVPPELVLGCSSASSPLATISNPAVLKQHVVPDNQNQDAMKRRRSLSAVTYQHAYSLDALSRSEVENRAKDTISDVERMVKIKRAQKIEQIFGESPSRPRSMSIPPRPSSAEGLVPSEPLAPTTPLKRTTVATPTPKHPQNEPGFKPKSPFVWKEGRRPSTAGSSRPSTTQSTTGLLSSSQKDVERNKKNHGKHQHAHSAQLTNSSAHIAVGIALGSPSEDLDCNDVLDISPNAMVLSGSKSPVMPGVPTSRQFLNYRNSLNSLSKILDDGDRQSLNDLHAVLHSDEEEDGPDLQSSALPPGSIETQRMLQPRASFGSINSVATTSTFATLTPNPMAFQARRKRAAKLAHFFGASYRDLFGEVLDRIERGMLEEARAGELSQEEFKHLMKQLNGLKSGQSRLS